LKVIRGEGLKVKGQKLKVKGQRSKWKVNPLEIYQISLYGNPPIRFFDGGNTANHMFLSSSTHPIRFFDGGSSANHIFLSSSSYSVKRGGLQNLLRL
jgi:hypothetical protein